MEAKEESKHCGPRKKREVQKNKWKEKGKKNPQFYNGSQNVMSILKIIFIWSNLINGVRTV